MPVGAVLAGIVQHAYIPFIGLDGKLAVRERENPMSTTPDEAQPQQPTGSGDAGAIQPTTPLPEPFASSGVASSGQTADDHPTVPLPGSSAAWPPASQEQVPAAQPPADPMSETQHFTAHAPAPTGHHEAAYAFGGTAANDPSAATATAQPQRHGGGLIAGIAIGALLGGLVGGGAAAVVASNVGGKNTVQSSSQSGGTLTLNNAQNATAVAGVAAVATRSVVTIQASDGSNAGTGSGVIYSDDGYIITNAHVATLEGATSNPELQVQLSDGTLYKGKLVGSDPFADIAVVKIEATGLTPIKVADSGKIDVGDLAVAIGAPLSLSNTVTSGVVSALNRGITIASSMVPDQQSQDGGQGGQNQQNPNDPNNQFPWFQFENPNGNGQSQQQASSSVAIPVIQTDASINPGNSGGALLDGQGRLIGINVALASAAGSDSGAAGSDGLGFAVPSNLAIRVADALIKGEQPSHGLLGVTQTGESSTTNEAGGVIGSVTSGSAADKAGLKAGDVITSINGARADSFTTVTALVRMYPAGTEIAIGYNRNGQQLETTATLGEMKW